MIFRRHGETDGQFCVRLEAELKAVEAKCIELNQKLVDQDIQNLRNGRKYKNDANDLFHALAVAHGLLPANPDIAKTVVNEAIQLCGFNNVDISTGMILDDGAYLNEKK